MNWKSTAAVSGATLLATWLGWTPSRPLAVDATVPTASREARPVAAAADIEEQAARLQTRVRDELDYRDPARNPFRFVARPAVVAAAPRIAEPPPGPLAEQPGSDLLPYTLSGMAADTIDGRLQRTAIISTASDVLFVKEGDHVGRYVATAVDEHGVELTAADGTIRRLILTP